MKSRQRTTANWPQTRAYLRVDPNLPAVNGVITDAAGNLYISDSQVGVVMVPNPSGTPQTASAVLVSGVPAGGEVSIDAARNLMYVPTSQSQTNGQADVAKVGFGYARVRLFRRGHDRGRRVKCRLWL